MLANTTKAHNLESRKTSKDDFAEMKTAELAPNIKMAICICGLNENKCEAAPLNGAVPQRPPRPLSNSKSSDWTDVSLEVPAEEEIQLKDPKLAFVFNEDETPTPPPRKNKKGIREKIEAVAKSGLQALQPKKPVEEELCVKKTIIYDCPGCDNREHKHNYPKRTSTPKSVQKQNNNNTKESKRRKNLSIVSLPNYNELKFTLANNGETIEKLSDSEIRKSVHSLPGETKKLSTLSDKRDYITRCRSFGSSLPQLLLHKLSNAKAPLAEIESDDSFGGLDDWDLKFIEHYNPKDSSLPRKSKPLRTEQDVLSDIECLIVSEEDIEPPKPPIRRQESLVKKINRTAAETAHQRSNEFENPSTEKDTTSSSTPPPSPTEKSIENPLPPPISLADLPTKDEDGRVEHSSLMRILQEFSTKKLKKVFMMGDHSIPGPSKKVRYGDPDFEETILKWAEEEYSSDFSEEDDGVPDGKAILSEHDSESEIEVEEI
ncbi:hypothetical protein MML48_1g07181 [Holotrichia oblita]|uniref:Uncharacterized protein n=1 Tax=Holotrichia oblita TaxID=644536 RepID=A0ACB9TU80_HOLOL|nr:hypothetical protein MML48_1g07181 [Holotrichia oblita]